MPLRVLHTSDWHLGRSLHEELLLEDQAWILDRFVSLAHDERPDAVVVAGDIYDRAVPPAEAVQLLDETLTRLADLRIPVVVIAGNHDSAERISFGARLLASCGIHLRGGLGESAAPIEVPGKGFVYALPFVEYPFGGPRSPGVHAGGVDSGACDVSSRPSRRKEARSC